MEDLIKSLLAICALVFVFVLIVGVRSTVDTAALCQEDTVCLIDIAKETKNVTVCERSSDVKACYEELSLVLDDPSLCLNSLNETLCYTRHAVLTQNVTLCSFALDQNYCVFQVASDVGDVRLCEKGTRPEICYFSYAIATQNTSLCDLSYELNKSCLLRINGILS